MLTGDAEANARIEDAFEQWSRAVDLPGKLRTMRMARAETGEAFALLVNNPGVLSQVSLDVKLIEADQVCSPLMRRGRSDEIDGILLDQWGNPSAYRVLKRHPGDSSALRAPADDLLAYDTLNDVFWTAFLNNAAFFSAGNKNFVTGADTVLGIDGLTKVEQAFMDLVDSDGKPTGVMPSIMLVPTALSAMGTQLYKSVELRDTTANTKFPVANPHQGKFRIEVSRYLANAIYTGNSAKAWYLLADPNDLPVIEVAFLDGKEAPTVESSEADFNMLGIRMRGYHDFGVNLQDPRGGVKSKGEV